MTAAPVIGGAVWEVDEAAPTWVKSEPPLASDMEATRVWRAERSGVRATEAAEFAEPLASEAQTRLRVVPVLDSVRESFPELPARKAQLGLPSVESTLVFPLERRLLPASALGRCMAPPIEETPQAAVSRRALLVSAVAAACVTLTVLFAATAPFLLSP